MKTITELLSINLKDLRKKNDWSQERLAEFAGVSPDVVIRAEGKTNFPKQDKITKLAKAFGVHEFELFIDHDVILKPLEPTPHQALEVLTEVVASFSAEKLQVRLQDFDMKKVDQIQRGDGKNLETPHKPAASSRRKGTKS